MLFRSGAAFILGMMLVVFIQYNYAIGRDRGFRPERVAYVYHRLENPDNLRSVLLGLPYVESVASASASLLGFYAPHMVTDNQGNRLFSPRFSIFDTDYLDFIGLRLKAGKNLSGSGQLLVNRTFVEKMK